MSHEFGKLNSIDRVQFISLAAEVPSRYVGSRAHRSPTSDLAVSSISPERESVLVGSASGNCVGSSSVETQTPVAIEAIRFYLHQYGRYALSYATMQPDLQYLVLAPHGYLAFAECVWMGRLHWLVLGDPVCDPSAATALLDSFLFEASNSNAICSFWQIDWSLGVELQKRGYFLADIGEETAVPLDSFTPRARGEKWRFLRRCCQIADDSKVSFTEITRGDTNLADLADISERWRHEKSTHANELRFLAKPETLTLDPEVRRFVARTDGRIRAFATFDPIYWLGSVIGYYVASLRSLDREADKWRSAIIAHAGEVFRREGKRLLSMGWSPCSPSKEAVGNRWTRFIIESLYRHGNDLYNFRGLDVHKRKYPNRIARRVFLATPDRIPLRSFFALLKFMKIRILHALGKSASRILQRRVGL